MFKRLIPFIIAIAIGLLTLLGLLSGMSQAVGLLFNWAIFLTALALLLGILNLFLVHWHRFITKRNLYSLVLLLSMFSVLPFIFVEEIAGIGVDQIFTWVQVPLEAAVASLLSFFLIFIMWRLLKQPWNVWSGLFFVTILVMMFIQVFPSIPNLPSNISLLSSRIRDMIDGVFVTAGMRGLLIGVALGTVMLSLRILVGLERPYNK